MTLVSADRKLKRAELLGLLLEHGILRRSETQPVLSRDGSSARWMLDSLPVTLTLRGAELAGQMLLERLAGFDGRQLATYGLTAVPILQSAILQSEGYYHGLLVRRERKPHGSQKLIEGRIDLDEPVILIEDSIASGTNVNQGIATLESAGLRVEGCVALVRFGWEGGFSDLRERGYHVEAVYDIFEDFMTRMEGEQGPDYNPTKEFATFIGASVVPRRGCTPRIWPVKCCKNTSAAANCCNHPCAWTAMIMIRAGVRGARARMLFERRFAPHAFCHRMPASRDW